MMKSTPSPRRMVSPQEHVRGSPQGSRARFQMCGSGSAQGTCMFRSPKPWSSTQASNHYCADSLPSPLASPLLLRREHGRSSSSIAIVNIIRIATPLLSRLRTIKPLHASGLGVKAGSQEQTFVGPLRPREEGVAVHILNRYPY